jgi:hypothetical protein
MTLQKRIPSAVWRRLNGLSDEEVSKENTAFISKDLVGRQDLYNTELEEKLLHHVNKLQENP